MAEGVRGWLYDHSPEFIRNWVDERSERNTTVERAENNRPDEKPKPTIDFTDARDPAEETQALFTKRGPYVEEEHRNERGELHRSPKEGPAQVTIHDRWEDRDGHYESRTELFAVNGRITGRREVESGHDDEGSIYREHNYDAEGKLHAARNEPAVIIRENHNIPEETHLDESRQEFWRHGVMHDYRDSTYEDIAVYKPLQVRQAFGWDVDGREAQGQPPRADDQVFDLLAEAKAARTAIREIDSAENPRPTDAADRRALLDVIGENVWDARQIRSGEMSIEVDRSDRGISR